MIPRIDHFKPSMLEMFSFVEDLWYIAAEDAYFRKRGNENEDFRKVWSYQVLIEITQGFK